MNLREAAQQALEALEAYPFEDATKRNVYAPVIIMLKGALSEPESKPLTDEEIWREYQGLWPFHPAAEPKLAADIAAFARVIERAHGIGGEA
jgi:hypothetical protein